MVKCKNSFFVRKAGFKFYDYDFDFKFLEEDFVRFGVFLNDVFKNNFFCGCDVVLGDTSFYFDVDNNSFNVFYSFKNAVVFDEDFFKNFKRVGCFLKKYFNSSFFETSFSGGKFGYKETLRNKKVENNLLN